MDYSEGEEDWSQPGPIKVMADYCCWPLWWDSGHIAWNGCVGDIDPRMLGISEDLAGRLGKWAERFNAVLNWEDPANSDFMSEAEAEQFQEDGRKLAKHLAEELGPNFPVRYWRDPLPKHLQNPGRKQE